MLQVQSVSARVVVIGNLSVGGSGKTPLVAWLARELTSSGSKVGIVTRGYGRKRHDVCEVNPNACADTVGDEPLWLARETGVPVVAGRDRAAAARWLLDALSPSALMGEGRGEGANHTSKPIILADDGLQHYRLARTIEIVAVDARRGLGNGAMLPAGPLREAPSRLGEADAIVVKGQGEVVLPAGVPTYRMRLSLCRAVPLCGSAGVALAHFRGQCVHAVAAIADPEGFFVALEAAGLEIERHGLSDHAQIDATLATLGSERPILVTDKDAARLTDRPGNVWRVPLAIGFSDEDAARLLALVRGVDPSKEKVDGFKTA